MNTETGRIYESDKLCDFDSDWARGRCIDPNKVQAHYMAVGEPMTREQERDEFERALAAGHAVPVSGQVVQQARLGQREMRRRKSRRKIAKQSRRRNRA